MSHHRYGTRSPVDKLSDDQIREAIRTNRSWRSVNEVLGFGRASHRVTKRIQERARALGCVMDHILTGAGGAGWNKGHQADPLDNPRVHAWRTGLLCGHTGKTLALKPFVRAYMKAKANNACQRCGWNQVHPTTGTVPLQVNHIDGDPSNTVESNLEAICPNCHALTPNYMNLNPVRGKRCRK